MSIESDASNVEIMTVTEGWQIYHSKLQEEFDKEYKKLRTASRDAAFYKLRGRLDALEFALNLARTIIDRRELI